MIKVSLIGYGRMGKTIEELINQREDMIIEKIIEPLKENLPPDFGVADVVIDFSHPDNLGNIINALAKIPVPLIIATTGYSKEQEQEIFKLSRKQPVFYASNFSLGISLMKRLVVEMKRILGEEFDIEIVEKHHRKKVDAPSGTALSLATSLDSTGDLPKVKGIHAMRIGTVAGEHTVIFAGENELLEITHKAESPKIFAAGAIRAAHFITKQPPGLYGMESLQER